MSIPIKERWKDGQNILGGWLSTPSTVIAEATARMGFDYVCVDTQHGAIGYADAVPMIQAILLGNSSPVVRVPWNDPGIIGKMLDAGAHGLIVPMVNTPEDAQRVVEAARYAPLGSRSYGPTVAAMRNNSYLEWASENVVVIPMIETNLALTNLEDILQVPGIDAIYVGPADLSLRLGLPTRNNDGHTTFDKAYSKILKACELANIMPGCHATGEVAADRLEAGFRMVTVTSDLNAARIGYGIELAQARKETNIPASGDTLF